MPLPLTRFIHPAVERSDLLPPTPAVPVFQVQDIVQRPMKVVGNVGYLLVQSVEGVAYDSPPRLARSTSNAPLQWGQTTCRVVLPVSLICR